MKCSVFVLKYLREAPRLRNVALCLCQDNKPIIVGSKFTRCRTMTFHKHGHGSRKRHQRIRRPRHVMGCSSVTPALTKPLKINEIPHRPERAPGRSTEAPGTTQSELANGVKQALDGFDISAEKDTTKDQISPSLHERNLFKCHALVLHAVLTSKDPMFLSSHDLGLLNKIAKWKRFCFRSSYRHTTFHPGGPYPQKICRYIVFLTSFEHIVLRFCQCHWKWTFRLFKHILMSYKDKKHSCIMMKQILLRSRRSPPTQNV